MLSPSRYALDVSSAFQEAADLVRKGWTKGAYCRNAIGSAVGLDVPTPRRVDLAHALARTAASNRLDEEALRSIVTAELPEPYRSDRLYGIERWNDTELRSKTDVVVLLSRVADTWLLQAA